MTFSFICAKKKHNRRKYIISDGMIHYTAQNRVRIIFLCAMRGLKFYHACFAGSDNMEHKSYV